MRTMGGQDHSPFPTPVCVVSCHVNNLQQQMDQKQQLNMPKARALQTCPIYTPFTEKVRDLQGLHPY